MQPCRTPLRWVGAANWLPLQGQHIGFGAAVFAREHLQQFALPVARYACQPQHLARAQLQAQVVQIHAKWLGCRQCQAMQLQHHIARLLVVCGQCRRLITNHHAA